MEALHLLFQTSCYAISSIIFSRNFFFFFFLVKIILYCLIQFSPCPLIFFPYILFNLPVLTFTSYYTICTTPTFSYFSFKKKKKGFLSISFFPFSFSLLVDFLKLHLLFFHLWFFFFFFYCSQNCGIKFAYVMI